MTSIVVIFSHLFRLGPEEVTLEEVCCCIYISIIALRKGGYVYFSDDRLRSSTVEDVATPRWLYSVYISVSSLMQTSAG